MTNYNFEDLKHPPSAIEFLSKCLRKGTLVLFLGAGASKGFGLPNWKDLINSLRTDVGLPDLTGSPSADDLQHAADEVKTALNHSDDAFLELIRNHLYADSQKLPFVKLFDNHLLISVSALLMGSKRGHVSRVVTLNFDSMLEWFLSLYGFIVKTTFELPDLEGSEDVRIYHPHGFIPHPLLKMKSSDFVILGMDSVNERLGTPGEPWFEMTRHILDTGVCLFIGMSGNTLSDRILAPLLNTCSKKSKSKRPLGIWILKEGLSDKKANEFRTNNIIPIPFTSEEDISEFLLNICQKAMTDIN